MGLVSHALAFGVGYLLGRPGGREQFMRVGQQVTELAEKPEVKRLAARGRELATDRAQAAKGAVTARVSRKTADSGSPASPSVNPSVSPSATPPPSTLPSTSSPATSSPATSSPATSSPATSPRADAPPTVPSPSSRPAGPSDG